MPYVPSWIHAYLALPVQQQLDGLEYLSGPQQTALRDYLVRHPLEGRAPVDIPDDPLDLSDDGSEEGIYLEDTK